MYRLTRPFLFRLEPERAHDVAVDALAWSSRHPAALRALQAAYAVRDPRLRTHAFGLEFPNPVGLAAGMDKNAVAVPAFAALGFGAVEIGSVTAEPQPGNPQPRMFRLPEDEAIVNRMGFNNAGAAAAAERLAKLRARGAARVPVGANVGKSRSAPLELAQEDYARSLRAVWPHADYLVVNVSSPNTPGLRDLQHEHALHGLLQLVSTLRMELPARPVLLKIAPDVGGRALDVIVQAAEAHGVDGLVATNTTVARTGLRSDPGEAGGLSGRPLAERSLELLIAIRARSDLPVVSVGGIASAEDVLARLRHGASFVQVYTALVYRGPGLAGAICRDLLGIIEREGAADLADLVQGRRGSEGGAAS